MTERTLKLQCRGCGASSEYSAADQALKCQYCGTVTEIPKTEEALPDAAQAVVPLTVELSGLTDAVYEHLASGALTPDHLLEHATFSKKERFYVPTWTFHGTFEAHWTASFGYDRKEHYTAYETRTENGHSRQVPVTKTKTVTDWRPDSGTASGEFSVMAYAGKLLPAGSPDVVGLVEGSGRGGLTAFDTSYVSGIPVEPFELSELEAYDSRAQPQVNAVIDHSVRQYAQGDHQRDWHWTGSVQKEGLTVLVPVCHAVYEFEGKQYNVWTSGGDVSRLVADPLPIDARRRDAIRFGYLPSVAALISAAIAVFKFELPWMVPVGIAVAAAAYGLFRAESIKSYSLKLRQSMLAGRRAASANTSQMTHAEQQKVLSSVKRPPKPWMANTSSDRLVLPALTIALALAPLGPAIRGQGGSSTEPGQLAETTQRVAPAAAPTIQQAAPTAGPAIQYQTTASQASEPPVATAAAIPAPEATASAPAAAAAKSDDAPVESVATTPAAAKPSLPLASVLLLAKDGEWGKVDEQVALVRSQPLVAEMGDRKAARASNNQGLAFLKGNDFAAATTAFERGVSLDGSDIEVRNNLGYALLKAGLNDEAIAVLGRVLLQAPDRSSAWANLSEAAVNYKEMSLSALQVAVHFSANRDKTLTYLRQSAESHPQASYRGIASAVLANVDAIPANPNDRPQQPKAQTVAVTTALQVRPSVPERDELADAIAQMVAEGEGCFVRKQYGCAITNASNVLRMKPSSASAQQLKMRSESAQAEAMRNIEIK